MNTGDESLRQFEQLVRKYEELQGSVRAYLERPSADGAPIRQDMRKALKKLVEIPLDNPKQTN